MRLPTSLSFIPVFLLVFIFLSGCENREVTPEDLSIREIHTSLPDHFNTITVDGEDYLILERDRNNPHEGFGFMALRGNKIYGKLDSIAARQTVILKNQARILSLLEGRPQEDFMFENTAGIQDALLGRTF